MKLNIQENVNINGHVIINDEATGQEKAIVYLGCNLSHDNLNASISSGILDKELAEKHKEQVSEACELFKNRVKERAAMTGHLII